MPNTWTQKQVSSLTGLDKAVYDSLIQSQGLRPADALNQVRSIQNSRVAAGGASSTPDVTKGNTPPPPPPTKFIADDGSEWSTADARDARNLQLRDQGFQKQQAEAQKTAQRVSAKESLTAWLNTFFDPVKDATTIAQLGNFLDQQITSDTPTDAIMINIRKEPAYIARFKGNEGLRAAGLAELTPAEYLQAEQTYSSILTSANLEGLATRNNFASMIGGQVSAVELQDRVVNVYDRIKNADTALKAEMQRLNQLGNITSADFAQSLLMGKEGAASLKRKIAQAEISTEFTTRGIQSALGTTELANLGVTRQQAQTGAEYAKMGTQRLGELASIYGADTAGIQSELESEAFKGLESQRRKKLTAQEKSAFSGSAGMGQPSLASGGAGGF